MRLFQLFLRGADLDTATHMALITDYATVARSVDAAEFDEHDFVIVGGGAPPLSSLTRLIRSRHRRLCTRRTSL